MHDFQKQTQTYAPIDIIFSGIVLCGACCRIFEQAARVRHSMPPPPCKLTISFAFIRQVAVLFRHNNIFARWHLFRHVGYLRHQQQVDLWPFDLESGVRIKCDVGYLCANFSLPRPLCSRVRPSDARQTDVRRQTKASLNASALWGQRHNNGARSE